MSDRSNLRPHAEARLAMGLYDHEYAHEQRGGSMDFWNSLSLSRKRIVRSILDDTITSLNENRRAPSSDFAEHSHVKG